MLGFAYAGDVKSELITGVVNPAARAGAGGAAELHSGSKTPCGCPQASADDGNVSNAVRAKRFIVVLLSKE